MRSFFRVDEMVLSDLNGGQDRLRVFRKLDGFFMGKADKFEKTSALRQHEKAVHLALASPKEVFVQFDDHGADLALRFSIFCLATFAWATAASCWSPKKIRILLILSCDLGIKIFSKRLTRMETSR